MTLGTIELEPGITVTVCERSRRWVSGPLGRGYYTESVRDMRRKSRIFVFPKNEPLFENMVNRRNRPVDQWRAILKERVNPRLGLPTTGMRWNTKAGCSMCPCSPGFTLPGWFGAEGPLSRDNWNTLDFHVEIDFATLGESGPSTLDADEVSIRAMILGQQVTEGVVADGALVAAGSLS